MLSYIVLDGNARNLDPAGTRLWTAEKDICEPSEDSRRATYNGKHHLMAVTHERKRLEIKGHISLGRGSPHLLFLQLTSSLHRRDWCCERRRRLITESGEGVGSLSALGSVLVLLTRAREFRKWMWSAAIWTSIYTLIPVAYEICSGRRCGSPGDR